MRSTTDRWRPAQNVVWQAIEGQVLLVLLGRNESTFLNPVGSALWTRLDGRTGPDGLAEELAAACQIPRAQADGAVEAFLESLRALRLVDRSPAGGAPPGQAAAPSPPPLDFPSEYEAPAVAPVESLQLMGGCTSNDPIACLSLFSV